MNRLKFLVSIVAMLLSLATASAADATKPDKAVIDEMVFPNGEYVGHITFTLPTKTEGGANISEELTYQVYAGGTYASLTNLTNYRLVGEGTGSAGQTFTIDGIDVRELFPQRENWSVTFTVFVFNSVGNSFKYSAVFVGYDDPAPPTNVHASVDPDTRLVTLTWDAPQGAKNVNTDGYVDIENLTYTIIRYPGESEMWAYGERFIPVEVATNMKGTVFTETLPDDPYTGYCYRIEASNHGQTSVPYWGYSDTIKVGRPWPVPYLDTFSDPYQFNRYEWQRYYEGNVLYSWWSQNGCLQSSATASGKDADYWLISPPILLEEGNRYETSLMARMSAKRTHGTLTFAVGQGWDPSTYTVVAEEVNVPWIDEYTFTKVGGSFTVPSTGDWHVAIHDVTKRLNNAYHLVADSFRVDLLSAVAAPDSVTQLKVTPGERGALSATVSFLAPSVNTNGGAIASLARIEVLRTANDEETTLRVIEAPVPGQAYSVQDAEPIHGYNTYTVKVYNASGKGLDAVQTLYIGPDAPTEMKNVVVTDLLNDQQQIRLSWSPMSTVGVHGGYVDPETLDYNIYLRGEDAQHIGNLFATQKDTTLVIDGVKVAEGDPSFIWFYVEAVNSEGKTALQYSNTLVCGDPYPLPFIEKYPNGQAQYYWWYSLDRPDDYDNENGYAFTLDGYHGVGKEMGCASWRSNNNDEVGTLRSCKINTLGVIHPTMEMYMRYDGPVQPNIYIGIMDQATNRMDTAYVFQGTLKSGDKNWTHVVADLSKYKDMPYMLLNIIVHTPQQGTTFYVDNISVYDLMDYDIETTIDNTLASVKAGVPTVFNVHAKNLGLNTNARWKMNLYANNQLVDTKNGKALEVLQDSILKMTYTPKTNDPENIELYAELEWEPYDLNEDNNRSAICDLKLLPSDYDAVNDLSAVPNDDATELTLIWSEPNNARTVFEDFESFTPWQDTFGKWTSYDEDKIVNFVPGTWTFPWMGEAYGWGLFDITDVVSSIGSSLDTQSGNQCLFSMSTAMSTATKTYPPSDDWLITPLLSGRAQTLSFYLKDYSSSLYQSQIEVLTSTTGKEIADFTLLKSYPKGMIPGKWTEQKFNLPEGTKYLAVRSRSQNSFCVMIDDVTYEAGGGQVLGYKVYQDGQLISTIEGAETTDLTIPFEAGHHYNVTTLYEEGESPMSNTAVSETPAAIATVELPAIGGSRQYNAKGQRISSPQHGLNLIQHANGTVKKIYVK